MRPLRVCTYMREEVAVDTKSVNSYSKSQDGEREGVSVCVRPVSFQSLFSTTTTLNYEELLQWLLYHVEVMKVKTIYLLDR